jgi:hypothetical protein
MFVHRRICHLMVDTTARRNEGKRLRGPRQTLGVPTESCRKINLIRAILSTRRYNYEVWFGLSPVQAPWHLRHWRQGSGRRRKYGALAFAPARAALAE